MTNLMKYDNAFIESIGVEKEQLNGLMYQAPGWDSVGHMSLIAALEEQFNIMIDTDDIIDFNSYEKGKEILAKYNVEF